MARNSAMPRRGLANKTRSAVQDNPARSGATLDVVLRIRDAVSIPRAPSPVGPLVLGPDVVQLSPIRLGIGIVRRIQRAGNDNDNMPVGIAWGLLRSFEPADHELPGGGAVGGCSSIPQRRPAVSAPDGI